VHTFWRLLGFLRPYRRAVLISFALAAVAMGTGVLIPFLVGQTVDEIRGDGANLTPLALAVVAAGVLRLAFSVSRRWAWSTTCATGCTSTCTRWS
jgi:ABC-type multidrug transport system fused ATPase/permease subunit